MRQIMEVSYFHDQILTGSALGKLHYYDRVNTRVLSYMSCLLQPSLLIIYVFIPPTLEVMSYNFDDSHEENIGAINLHMNRLKIKLN